MNKLTSTRTVFKPFEYPWAYEYFLQSEQMHWIPTELPMHEDVYDWENRLTQPEKDNINHILRFFTQGDIDVAGAYINKYLPVFKLPELRMMLSSFAAREAVHIQAYSHLIETLGMPETTYSKFLDYEEMKDKHDYTQEFINRESGENETAEEIAVFSAFTEGLQLFGSFIILLNYTRFGKMKNMGQIIAWSIKDESLHTEAMIKLFRTYVQENKRIWNDNLKKRIYNACRTMVDLEDRFIDLAFSGGHVDGLSADDVKNYIRYLADRRLLSLGLKPNFLVKTNPLPWVEELINLPKHTNFFENKEVEYGKGALTGSWKDVWV